VEVLVRSNENNPFQPGAGAVPDVWVGRRSLLPLHDDLRRDRIRGRYTTGTVFIGPSGIGKSVLVNRFAQRSADTGDVVLDAVRVAKRSDPVAQLATAVGKAAAQIAGRASAAGALEAVLQRLSVVSLKGVRFAVAEEHIANPHLVVRDSLIELGTVLATENATRPPERQRAVVVRIDELQNADNSQRSALLSALGDVLEHRADILLAGASTRVYLPVVLHITGLPDLLNKATNVDTFRRRFVTQPLSLFEDREVIDALLDTDLPDAVRFELAAAHRLAEIVAGDPYLFQLVGKHAWAASAGDTVTVTDVEMADTSTYPERLRVIEAASEDIPAREGEVLDAVYALADEHGEVKAGAVATHLGTTPPKIAAYGARLERRAALRRERGTWRVVHRLLHRYRTTGDIA
jgi:hypothetical protein